MDTEMQQVSSQLRLSALILEHRRKRLATTKSKLSLHYAKVQHTAIMIDLLQELTGVVMQDPSNWEDEPDIIPF